MKYFTILEELFTSDSVIFLIIGVIVALIWGFLLKSPRKCIVGVICSAAIYAVCELASIVHTNFMLEIILLFVGTVAIGCCLGFAASLLIGRLRTGKAS